MRTFMRDLLSDGSIRDPIELGESAFVLPGSALGSENMLLEGLNALEKLSSFRHMMTPNGHTMSLGLINCGRFGWTSSQFGYRYTASDPLNGQPWPAMPEGFAELANQAAAAVGFNGFEPDACVINQYLPGAKLSLHQDKNERDMRHPVVTISLGMTATFLFGGLERSDRVRHIELHHGDIAIWGGADRLNFHGVLPLGSYQHPIMGRRRLSITFRKAG